MTLSSRNIRSFEAPKHTATMTMTAGSPLSGQEDVGRSQPRLAIANIDIANIQAEFTEDEHTDNDNGGLSTFTTPIPTPRPLDSPACLDCLTPSRSLSTTDEPTSFGGSSEQAVTPNAVVNSGAPPQPSPAVCREVPQCTYRLSTKLGEGCAQVFRATVVSSNIDAAPRGAQVAVKIYDTSQWTSAQFKHVRGEITSMTTLFHNNIVRFYSCKYENEPNSLPSSHRRGFYGAAAVRRGPQIVIVQELCSNKDMFDNVQKYGEFPEAVAIHYFRELMRAVAHMHSCRVAHRDLKLENIVLNREWVLKVCDFGHAIQWAAGVTNPKEFYGAGTDRYRSPEVQAKVVSKTSQRYSQVPAPCNDQDPASWYDPRQLDAWAAAVIFFEMLLGHPPMAAAKADDWYFDKISKGKWNAFWTQHKRMCSAKSPTSAAKISPAMQSFFEAVFCPSREQRLTVAEMLAHPYVSDQPELPPHAIQEAMHARCR